MKFRPESEFSWIVLDVFFGCESAGVGSASLVLSWWGNRGILKPWKLLRSKKQQRPWMSLSHWVIFSAKQQLTETGKDSTWIYERRDPKSGRAVGIAGKLNHYCLLSNYIKLCQFNKSWCLAFPQWAICQDDLQKQKATLEQEPESWQLKAPRVKMVSALRLALGLLSLHTFCLEAMPGTLSSMFQANACQSLDVPKEIAAPSLILNALSWQAARMRKE